MSLNTVRANDKNLTLTQKLKGREYLKVVEHMAIRSYMIWQPNSVNIRNQIRLKSTMTNLRYLVQSSTICPLRRVIAFDAITFVPSLPVICLALLSTVICCSAKAACFQVFAELICPLFAIGTKALDTRFQPITIFYFI